MLSEVLDIKDWIRVSESTYFFIKFFWCRFKNYSNFM